LALAVPLGRPNPFFSTSTWGYNHIASASLERINGVKALRLLWCLALAACADLETKPWYKVDGSQASTEALEVDKTACRQEMQRSVDATNRAAGLDRDVVRTDIYGNCMARLGYSDKSTPRLTPPPPAGAPPAAQGSPPPVAQGAPPRPVAQGRSPPPGASPPPSVASAPPPPPPQPAQDCRTPTDLRMWLPLCP
jgi:hypothetical protein